MSDRHAQATLKLKEVTSAKNPIIKEVSSLTDSAKSRRVEGRFTVEGLREVSRAIEAGWTLETALFDPSKLPLDELSTLINEALSRRAKRPFTLPEPSDARALLYVSCASVAFERVAYRSAVANVVGVFRAQAQTLSSLSERLQSVSSPLILVAEGVEKPGNLGALLRTANAMGVDALLACEARCDLYHPNALRNSLGGAFDLPVIPCSSEEATQWLKEHRLQIVTTYLEGATALERLDLTRPTALVVGAEDQGVTARWVEASDALALIPMQGVVDSLNVSVAAGMALFEATRQRRASARGAQ